MLTILLARQAAAQSAPPSFLLDMAAPATQEIALTVPAPGKIPVKILRSGAGVAHTVTLDITDFVNEQGVSVPVLMNAAGAGGQPQFHLENIPADKALLDVELQVPALLGGGQYSGRLILTVPGQPQATTVWRFLLTSSDDVRPATLVIDQNAVLITAVRPWCIPLLPSAWCIPGSAAPLVTVHVREKNNRPLYGVMARLEPGLKASGAGFDPAARIRSSFAGAAQSGDIFASPPKGERDVAARGQATITLSFPELAAGEYIVPLRFTAMNSNDDDAQRLTITLQVRDSIWGAVVVLVLAAMLSFLATRIVTGLRQRATLLDRMRNMRPAWLAEERPLLPVIWLRAALHQAEVLSDRYLLSGLDEIDTRLTAATSTLKVLDQIRRVRALLRATIHDPDVLRRALQRLDSIVQQLGAESLTKAEADHIEDQLEALARWSDPTEREKCYWLDMRATIESLCGEVLTTTLSKGDVRNIAEALLTKLRDWVKTEPFGLEEKKRAADAYARLSILWELHCYDEGLNSLTALPGWADEQPIQRIYNTVDNFWWHHLKKAELTIEGPPSDFEAPETYAPITFRVEAKDHGLRQSYLMRRKLTFRWTIVSHATRQWWQFWRPKEAARTLHVDSIEPKVAQYAPRSGRLEASVQITYEDRESVSLHRTSVPIRSSGDFKIWRAFETADVLAFAAALVASVVSGVMLYALAPTFGGAKDYLALFTWGASIDQGKSFLQSLAAYRSASDKPAAVT